MNRRNEMTAIGVILQELLIEVGLPEIADGLQIDERDRMVCADSGPGQGLEFKTLSRRRKAPAQAGDAGRTKSREEGSPRPAGYVEASPHNSYVLSDGRRRSHAPGVELPPAPGLRLSLSA